MRAGEVIADRFEILGHAGTGATASVYRAHDRSTGNVVAIKVLSAMHPYDFARFFREAAVLSGLRHEHIVEYVAFGSTDSVTYLVQEWVEGDTLAARLRSHGVTLKDAVAITSRVASALATVHALGVVHRDVKPGNIILAGGDPAHSKLVDFGIARVQSSAGALTRTGEVLGTPSYMPPEQARGELAITPAADVWALGCVLYKMLCGRVAFSGKSATAIRAKVLLDQPAAMDDTIPQALRELVQTMLEKDPAARPRDGAAVVSRLDALGELPDLPPRRAGAAEPPTLILPAQPRSTTTCYVFVAPVQDDQMEVLAARLAEIATRSALALHHFEDGSALLIADKPDRAGALDAAHAALALAADPTETAICVFGQNASDALETAIDRGAVLLDRSMMNMLFGAGTDREQGEHTERDIYVDETVEALLADAIPMARTDGGTVLRSPMAKQ
ncbi:MAG TPA: serine/threonine-protein kinase [Kofleriaceae bacterium]|nr:serine/threonine-protein kinase [Kofleriaceae bacterium]